MMRSWLLLLLLAGTAAGLVACPASEDASGAPGDGAAAHDDMAHEEVGITNRIAVPPSVVRNLGITFVPVERRAVGETLRLRGHFEATPTAYRAVHTLAGGRVELLVTELQRVAAGDLLARVQLLDWGQRQARITEAELAVAAARAAWVVAQRTRDEVQAEADLAVRLQGPWQARTEAHANHQQALQDLRRVREARRAELEAIQANGIGVAAELAEVRADVARLDAELAQLYEEAAELDVERERLAVEADRLHNQLPRLQAEAAEREAQVRLAERRVELLLDEAEREYGLAAGALREPVGSAGTPRWQVLTALEVRAPAAGLVESLAVESGAVVEAGAPILRLLDTRNLRFRAAGYQADLAKLVPAQRARILPPGGPAAGGQIKALPATLTVGLHADPHERTLELFAMPRLATEAAHATPPAAATTAAAEPGHGGGAENEPAPSLPAWARPGVSTLLEVEVDGSGATAALAIPLRAVITDGLERVYFRRDPRNPDQVIRQVGDFGPSDGEYIVVRSGLSLRDSVVLDGVYELKLASAGTQQAAGGHFHADGTWHADDDH